MPTGYTAIIEEKPDLTLREFALRCARGMGACIHQRDDPMDDLPKAPEASHYHAEEAERVRATLRELEGLSSVAALALFNAEVSRITRANAAHLAKCEKTRKRYASMRAKVEAWKPPTEQHEGLQRFMLEQIDLCRSDWTPYTDTVPNDPKQWLADKIESTRESIVSHAKRCAEELARTAERKQWIEALYASLPGGE